MVEVEIEFSEALVKAFLKDFLNSSARIREGKDHADQPQSEGDERISKCNIDDESLKNLSARFGEGVQAFSKHFFNSSGSIIKGKKEDNVWPTDEPQTLCPQSDQASSSLWPICIILACMLLSAVSYILYLKWHIRR